MLIYLLNYFMIPVWGCIKNSRLAISIISLQLFLILALRSASMGVDLNGYEWHYLYYQKYSFGDIISSLRLFNHAQLDMGWEAGYELFNWTIGKLGCSFHTFLVIHAVICVVSLSVFVYRYSRIPWLSFILIITIGMYGYMFCILRQSLAVAILYFSFPFIIRRELRKFLIVVFLAGQFHFIAYTFLPLYWLSLLTINAKKIALFFGISFSICIVMPFLNSFFTYMGRSYRVESLQIHNLYVFTIVAVIFLFFLVGEKLNHNKIDALFFWMLMLSLPLQVLGFFVPIMGRATAGLFLPVLSILVTNVISNEDNLNVSYYFSFLCFAVCFLYYKISFLDGTGLLIIPYRFFFD